MDKKLISYIFPVFNEEETLDVLYEEVVKSTDQIKDKYNFELIFVNDGSEDNSFDQLVKLSEKDDRVKVINFSRNFGHQMAITAGIDYVSGEAAVIMDADLQDPPSVSLELIEKWEEGFEVVYGQRRSRKDSFFKTLTARYFYKILDNLANINIPHDTGDFRLIDHKVIKTIREFDEQNRFMRGLFSFVGFKQTAVLYDRDARYAGKTKYPLSKMIKLGIDGILSFSTFPLKVIAQLGFFSAFLSILGIIYALAMFFFFPEVTVSGWTFMVITILFMSGVQLITLGMLGSYIGRIYQEVQNRPLYIIRSVIDNKE